MLDNKLFKRLWQLFLVVLPALFLAALAYVKKGDVAFFEYIATYIAPFVAWPIRFISNLLPFSITELAAWLLPLILFFVLLLILSRTIIWLSQTIIVIPRIFNNKYIAYWRTKTLFYWRYIGKLLFIAICLCSYVVSSYLLFHGFNYEREDIASKMHFQQTTIDKFDLEQSMRYIVRQLRLITQEPAAVGDMDGFAIKKSYTQAVLPTTSQTEITATTETKEIKASEGVKESISSFTSSETTVVSTDNVGHFAEEAKYFADPLSELAEIDAADSEESYLAAPLEPAFTKFESSKPSQTEKTLEADSTESAPSATAPTLSQTIPITRDTSEIFSTATNSTINSTAIALSSNVYTYDNDSFEQPLASSETFIVPSSNQELFDLATTAYRQAARKFSFLDGQTLTVKPVTMSYYWSFTHTTGMYMPLFMEANVNVSQLPPFLLFTAAHELAHQRFFAREDEANFLAFLTLSRSQNLYANYSAYLNAWNYLAKDLAFLNPHLLSELYAALPLRCRRDLELESFYWQQFNTNVAKNSQKVNDQFIRANGDKRGVTAYDEVSSLIVAYLKRSGKLRGIKQAWPPEN